MNRVDSGRRIEALTRAHDLDAFDCGEPARNAWLQTRALGNQDSSDSRTYVMAEAASVLGFHTLTVGSMLRSWLPGGLRRNAPEQVGCVLIGQLAVSVALQGHGIGRTLIVHAMGQTLQVAELAGCRLLGVHPARPELVRYYARFGFIETSSSPALMAMPMARVRVVVARFSDVS